MHLHYLIFPTDYMLNHHLEARQNRLELIISNLLPRRIRSRLIRCISNADTNIARVPEQNNIRLPRQPRAPTDLCILSAQKPCRNSRRDELELASTVALAIRNLCKVHVEEDILGEVRSPRLDERSSEVQSEVGVDLGVDRGGLVPGGGVAGTAREGNGRNFRSVCRVHCGADGAGEESLDVDVLADVGTCDGELGCSTVPECRASGGDTTLDGGHRVGVHVVETRVCGIGSGCRGSCWAGAVLATVRVDGLGC